MESMKAMSVGMIFGIIFAILVMGMLLIFGSDVITSIFCMGSDAQTQKVIGNLQDFVDELYTLPSGSGDYFTLNLPGDSKMCFVNSSHPEPVTYPEQFKNWKPNTIIQSIIKEEGYNIWYQQCSGLSGGKIDHLHIAEGGNFCTKSGMKLYLQNVGRWVTIIED
jgi:hypothetical protein